MKILISAYACQPKEGSEPGIGWNLVKQIAKYHEVWVLTRLNNEVLIKTELAKNPIPKLHFVYLDIWGWSKLWKPGEVGKEVRIHYYLWQIKAYFEARRLHKEIGFDLLHHLTYGQYSAPTFLSFLPVPLIWGIVGGGESSPKSFRANLSLRGKVYEILRDLSRSIGERDPFVSLTAKRCALALATTEDTAKRLRALNAKQIDVVGQCGLTTEEIEFLSNLSLTSSNPVKFISIGRLLHWKGFHLGLEAFARAQIKEAEYWIVGSGPERERLENLSKNLGILSQVKFWGKLSRNKTFEKLGDSHVLVHPSLHDSGGFVCIEAMAAGRPVICLDLGGPATQVTKETGFKVPARIPEQTVTDLAEAMITLAADRDLLKRMGKAGQTRVKETYNWNVKGELFAQLYEQILSRK
jgi:glycosyltransferase involved in cell wall biosynthesis